jgi:tRNA(Arg) A34 adenosine deaminase TadA
MKNDEYFLKRATEVGNRKAKPYNFGTIIVKDGKIIGEDFNHVHETTDPSAHAEISALKMACKTVGSHNLNGATMYGSHEPCVMCTACAAWTGVDRLVYAVKAVDQELRYELLNMTLEEFAKHLQNRNMTIEYMPLEAA